MSHKNYSLEIVSNHPEFKNKSLKKYYVDGIETIGAWGDEPFEIKFTNHSWQKVQVKLSLDGTDILTGAPANTEVNKDMWVVNGYATLTLKAWPETSNGGSQFVFTSAEKSVAVHTHGDLSNRGIIAAAVYTEAHVEPVRLNPYYNGPFRRSFSEPYLGGTYIGDNLTKGTPKGSTSVTLIGAQNYSSTSASFNASDCDSVTSSCFNLGEAAPASAGLSDNRSKNLESLVSVGAGSHVDQKITYVTGLIKPVLSETVRVKYLWWDELKAKLAECNVPVPHPSGFPGDVKQNIMSIGNTPKVGYNKPAFPRHEAVYTYSRV